MKHSVLSMLLLFGLGFAPALGFLGGGNTNYENGYPQGQQSTGYADETATKENAAKTPARQQTAERHEADSCAGMEESICRDPGIRLAK